MIITAEVSELTRKIKLPTDRVLSVNGDYQVDGIAFKLPATYEGDFDFSTAAARVHWTGVDKVEHTNLITEEDGNGYPLWIMPSELTQGGHGVIEFAISFVATDETAAITKRWISDPVSFRNRRTVSGSNEDEEAEEKAIYDRLASAIAAVRAAQASVDDVAEVLSSLGTLTFHFVDAKADMTDQTKLYVLTTDGYLYYYSTAASDFVPAFEVGGSQEVIDARTDENGTTYANLKTRINTGFTQLKEDLTNLTTRVDNIEEAEGLHRYGVSGIGQSASALTRLWDAVGMTAQVGTDGDNSGVINNFDDVTPFNRRKCVGKWHLENGKAVFHVHAYYGDEDYTEDGSMGDYVAVECPRAYYYLKDGVLGVSAHHYQGWRPFDIFCRNHDPEDTFEYYYMPAYALAEKDGHAVSLPNLDNMQGDYASLVASARTYDGDANTKAIIQPAAVNFYEWALYTVEFATQNCQSIMQGCSALRHSNDDHATLRSDGKWLLNNYQTARVAGEYISIQPTNVDLNSYTYYASHRITSIIRCDENGNASSSGTHQLVETEDLGVGRTYEIGGEYRFVARPYRTGSCNGVSTPSGSPVNNHSGYYPCKYRWHENPFGNQFKTACDLFNMRVGTGDNDYGLEWYYAPDPTAISGNPSQATLETDTFELLDVTTEHDNYVNGYIRSKKYSTERPDIWIPHVTTGAGTSSYFCDYASLVYSPVVRSVRFGGYWYSGAYAGFSSCNAFFAPSYASAFYGADLFILQEG